VLGSGAKGAELGTLGRSTGRERTALYGGGRRRILWEAPIGPTRHASGLVSAIPGRLRQNRTSPQQEHHEAAAAAAAIGAA